MAIIPYYVRDSDGDDTDNGLSSLNAWKHPPRSPNSTNVAATHTFAAGDEFNYEDGAEFLWPGDMWTITSHPGTTGEHIKHKQEGTGTKPIFDNGFYPTMSSGWSQVGTSKTYKTTMPGNFAGVIKNNKDPFRCPAFWVDPDPTDGNDSGGKLRVVVPDTSGLADDTVFAYNDSTKEIYCYFADNTPSNHSVYCPEHDTNAYAPVYFGDATSNITYLDIENLGFYGGATNSLAIIGLSNNVNVDGIVSKFHGWNGIGIRGYAPTGKIATDFTIQNSLFDKRVSVNQHFTGLGEDDCGGNIQLKDTVNGFLVKNNTSLTQWIWAILMGCRYRNPGIHNGIVEDNEISNVDGKYGRDFNVAGLLGLCTNHTVRRNFSHDFPMAGKWNGDNNTFYANIRVRNRSSHTIIKPDAGLGSSNNTTASGTFSNLNSDVHHNVFWQVEGWPVYRLEHPDAENIVWKNNIMCITGNGGNTPQGYPWGGTHNIRINSAASTVGLLFDNNAILSPKLRGAIFWKFRTFTVAEMEAWAPANWTNNIEIAIEWTQNTAISLNEFRKPTEANADGFIYRCTSAGTTHATTEPTWSAGTTNDNTVEWTRETADESVSIDSTSTTDTDFNLITSSLLEGAGTTAAIPGLTDYVDTGFASPSNIGAFAGEGGGGSPGDPVGGSGAYTAVTRANVAPAISAWNTVNLSTNDVPANSIAVLRFICNDTNTRNFGVRRKGGADTRIGSIYDTSQVTVFVCTDASSIIEVNIDSTEVEVWIEGYLDTDYVTPDTSGALTDITPGTSGSYQTIDISTETGAETATAALIEYNSGLSNRSFGYRYKGQATDDFYTNSAGQNYFIVGVDSNEQFEYKAEDIGDKIYLVGWFTQGFTAVQTASVVATDLSLGTAGSYQDITALPSGAAAGIFLAYSPTGPLNFAIRNKDESSYDSYYDVSRRQSQWLVEGDTSRVTEGKIESTAVDFFLIGTLDESATIDAPIGVAATAGDELNKLVWSNVAGATAYNIYHSGTSPVTTGDTKISDVTSPYYHTSLTNATQVFYAVTAEDAAGESALSSEVNATPASLTPYTDYEVYDLFTDTDTTQLNAHTPNKDAQAGGWSGDAGITISSNRMIAAATNEYCTIDSGVVIQKIEFYFNAGGAANRFKIRGRLSGTIDVDEDCYLLTLKPDLNTLNLLRIINSSSEATVADISYTFDLSRTYKITFELNDKAQNVYINDVQVITGLDTIISSGTKVDIGAALWTNANGWIENFTVEGVAQDTGLIRLHSRSNKSRQIKTIRAGRN